MDLTAVEAFLGRIGDPRATAGGPAPAVDPGRRAVMFTDIVGSTEMTARLGDAAALELVRVHDALVRRGLQAYGGREVKHTGDGIMAAFDKVANAVSAAADIQRRFAAYNSEASESLRVRIGIHAGEPVEENNDLFGTTVQLAYRLCSEAEANSYRRGAAVFVRDLFRQRWRFCSPKGCQELFGSSRREQVEHRLGDQRHTPVGAPETLRVELRVLAHHEAIWNLSLAADDGAGQPGVAADVRVRKDHRLADRRIGVNPRAGEQERGRHAKTPLQRGPQVAQGWPRRFPPQGMEPDRSNACQRAPTRRRRGRRSAAS